MKLNKKEETIKTYNDSAKELAERYDEIGPRISDIEETFALVRIKSPKVFEIGCGTGREAYQILKKTPNYAAIDISEGMLAIAKKRNPKGKFILADAEEFSFPKHTDIIFAFASLIHSNKKQLEQIFDEMYESLELGGVARVSLKWAPKYKEVTKSDKYGRRTYYLYSKEDIEVFPAQFLLLKGEINVAEGQQWLELLLKKPLL